MESINKSQKRTGIKRNAIPGTPVVDVSDGAGKFLYYDTVRKGSPLGNRLFGDEIKPTIRHRCPVDHSLYAITCREDGLEERKSVRVTWEGARMRTMSERVTQHAT